MGIFSEYLEKQVDRAYRTQEEICRREARNRNLSSNQRDAYQRKYEELKSQRIEKRRSKY